MLLAEGNISVMEQRQGPDGEGLIRDAHQFGTQRSDRVIS